MERVVIVAYKPFPGKESELLELMKTHVVKLRQENLVSAREPIIMQSEDGTVVETFGWKSKEAIELAHSNPVVQKLWEQFAEVCEYIPVGDVNESHQLFSEFTPIN